MIAFISGDFFEITPTYVVIESNGIGYLVNISLNTYSDITNASKGRLLIHYVVSVDIRSGESRHQLFGFSTEQEKSMFKMLVNISGISSSIAHMILSALKPKEFQTVVLSGDVKTLTSVKGIGPKLAQKVISELKEKLAKEENNIDIGQGESNSLRQEALSALTVLGFDRAGSVKVINNIIKNEDPKTVEALIKSALRQL